MTEYRTAANEEVAGLARRLRGETRLLPEPLVLDLGGWRLGVHSNSVDLLGQLADYFCAENALVGTRPDAHLEAIEAPAQTMAGLQDWPREPGKSGRKDAFKDLPGARLVAKVCTGMLFLQRPHCPLAVGPCGAHVNQVINFINTQYLNREQQQGAVLCHAAALSCDRQVLGLAGFSGGGKSTLMLRLLAAPQMAYITNDRLLLQPAEGRPLARGIPKLPRVNPGTLLHDQRLVTLLKDSDRQRYAGLPADQLWELEEKRDVPIRDVYGQDKMGMPGPLGSLVVLNWSRDEKSPLRLEPFDLREREDLMAAIMKSSGPFYVDARGRFLEPGAVPDKALYEQILAPVPLYQLRGRLDFDAARALIARHLEAKGPAVP